MDQDQSQTKPLSVSGAMALAKGALESCTVTLIGEVSEVSNKPGYKAVYFTVKDEQASLPAMIWRNRFQSAGVDLRVGMLVQLTGRFTLYAPKGRMNFDVFSLSVAGEGDLRLRVANLAKKLQAEGLMDPSIKRPLPSFPQTIGLVTSPRGAAVHDVLRTLRRRFPQARVLLAGVPIEGADAPAHLMSGINTLDKANAEVILLVRGGGSFEDLMPFNDEMLARAIRACSVSVVTGIGHEPDNSIADMVADLRASTPTAAAEAVSPNAHELDTALQNTLSHISQQLLTRLSQSRVRIDAYASRPIMHDPAQITAVPAQSLDITYERLIRAIPAQFARDKARCDNQAVRLASLGKTGLERYAAVFRSAASRLEDLSPLSVLGRGYSLTRTATGTLVKNINAVSPGDNLAITVADGTIDCVVEQTHYADRDIVGWKE